MNDDVTSAIRINLEIAGELGSFGVARHPIGVHVGSGLTEDDELRRRRSAAPGRRRWTPTACRSSWPTRRAGRRRSRARTPSDCARRDVTVVVHAPYVLNVASTNNRIRDPEPQAARPQHAQRGRGGRRARAGGARRARAGQGRPRGRRRQLAQDLRPPGRGRRLRRSRCSSRTPPAAATRWPATSTPSPGCGTRSASSAPGFVLDTCHAWAAGWDLATVVDDVRAITGRIDLVHLNNSRDPAGSSRDRHAPLTDGEIPTELLLEVARAADCPVILETPGDAAAHAEEIALLRAALARLTAWPLRQRSHRPHGRDRSAPSSTPPAGSSMPGQLVRTTSRSGCRTSRTTSAMSDDDGDVAQRPRRGRTTRRSTPRLAGAEVPEHPRHPEQRLGRPARAAASATAAGPAPPAAAATASTAGSRPCSAAGTRRRAGTPAGRPAGRTGRGAASASATPRPRQHEQHRDDGVEHRGRLPGARAVRRTAGRRWRAAAMFQTVSGSAGRLLVEPEEPAQLSGARTATGTFTDQPGAPRPPPPSAARRAAGRPAGRAGTARPGSAAGRASRRRRARGGRPASTGRRRAQAHMPEGGQRDGEQVPVGERVHEQQRGEADHRRVPGPPAGQPEHRPGRSRSAHSDSSRQVTT